MTICTLSIAIIPVQRATFIMDKSNTLAVLGSGLIGRNWAMIFAGAGYRVLVYDSSADQLRNAAVEIRSQLEQLEKKRLLRGNLPASRQLELIEYHDTLEAVLQNSFFVQECIPEVLDLKRELFKLVDKLVDDDVVISSSTSTFLPSALSDGLRHKARFIVSHPVCPPYFIRFVEVVPAAWTQPEVVDIAFNLMERVGQKPIKLRKEVPGFILNRIQYAILNESYNLIADDVTDVAGIETLMTEGLAMRYAFLGPLETAHLNADGFGDYCKRYAGGIQTVSKTFKSQPPTYSGPTAEKIDQQLRQITPLEKLAERRKWRDESIIKLSQLKENN